MSDGRSLLLSSLSRTQRGRLDRGDSRIRKALERQESTRRCSSSTTGARTGRRTVVGRGRPEPAVRYLLSHNPSGFGFAVRAGLDQFGGDAVAIVMADTSDDPDDLVRYYRLLEKGYDCAFGSRFVRGAAVHDYPALKLVMNRAVNSGIRALFGRLQRHDERVQGIPARGDRHGAATDVEPLQPDGGAPVEGDRARDTASPSFPSRGRTARPVCRSCRCRRWAADTCSSSSTRCSSAI